MTTLRNLHPYFSNRRHLTIDLAGKLNRNIFEVTFCFQHVSSGKFQNEHPEWIIREVVWDHKRDSELETLIKSRKLICYGDGLYDEGATDFEATVSPILHLSHRCWVRRLFCDHGPSLH